jgi:hypothetical protein
MDRSVSGNARTARAAIYKDAMGGATSGLVIAAGHCGLMSVAAITLLQRAVSSL